MKLKNHNVTNLKDLTTKEVIANQKQLQTTVEQHEVQLARFDALERFVRRWWPVAVAVSAIVFGLIGGVVWWQTTVETKDHTDKVESRLNKRIDSLNSKIN